jgi:predicted transcriptional regulator
MLRIPDDLLARLDERAKKERRTRTNLIQNACWIYLENVRLTESLARMDKGERVPQ